MAALNLSRSHKRFLKSVLVTAVIFSVTVLGLHIWFVNNARSVLKQIVTAKSQGKINLELSQLRFEFLSNKLQIREADLSSNTKLDQTTTYHVKFRKLTLRVTSFWSLLFQKQLLLDSIKLHDPEVEVFQWRKDTLSKVSKDELSISQEMGKLYNSMLDVLEGFGIERIIINNAKLSLVNKFKPGAEPVVISNIYFDLVRTAENVRKRDEFVKNEQSVELRTSDQHINLPGGRHQLAFKTFRLQLFSKRIELDSCTLTARATDSSKSSYKIFFKRLSLVGVDFNAMYTRNLIRADSVYCENPLFNIELNPSDGVSQKKGRPDPEKIIRDLTGDLDLAFVGVKDAGIHINVTGEKNRTLFNSNKDDFEMRGLRINADSSKPVTVARFDMLVRDYRLYNEDSSAAYSFDSVHFINNKISLNNFAIAISSRNTERNKKDFKIPYFELTGLDWYELVFNENLKAEEASLYNPIINYTKTHNSTRKKKINLFSALQDIDTLLALRKINIINGQVNMQLGSAASLNFKNANLSLFSDRLLQSRNKQGLRKAVDKLSFSHGVIRLKDMTLNLDNVRYTDKNFIRADRLIATSKNDKINAVLQDVAIDNLLLDDVTELITIDGIRWDQGVINVNTLASSNTKKNETNIELMNISASSTQLSYSNKKTSINTFIQLLKLSSFYTSSGQSPHLEGLAVAGKKLSIKNQPLEIKASSYLISGDSPSSITDVDVKSIKGVDSMQMTSSRINFSANINDFLANDFHLKDLEMHDPVIQLIRWNDSPTKNSNNQKFSFKVDKLTVKEPQVNVSIHKNDSSTTISIPKSEGGIIKASGFLLDNGGITVNTLSANVNAATFTKKTGEILGVEKGKANIELSKIQLITKEGKPSWSGQINSLQLQNPNSFTLGKTKSKLSISQTSLGNISLSSDYISDFNQILKYSLSAWIRGTTGKYVDSNTTLQWYNAEYDYSKRNLSLDSFSYTPTQSRDSVMARAAYQTDYITMSTGKINMADFNIEEYRKDSSILAGEIDVANPIISIYRDKQPPFLSGVRKRLPVDMIKRISLPVSIKRINLIDGLVSYTEKNARTRTEGTILLTHVDSKISRIKNHNIDLDDSLVFSVDAYLMDSALIKLRVKQAYNDSLSGFLMTLRMNPTSLTFLNPIIAPLSNVKIVSGSVDSFSLRAMGREQIALGLANMYYHNLRIKLYKNAELEESTLLTKAATFFANNFLIRKNNKGRTGVVYFERLQDRSFFNYLVKMTFSGMASSIGVKKNRKYIKQYERQLELKKLPPITGLDVQIKK